MDCVASGSHYNPGGKTHGDLGNTVRHAGDMGNILAEGGKARLSISVGERLGDLVNR